MERPPLNALQVFVHAARAQNMTRAAERLHLTVSTQFGRGDGGEGVSTMKQGAVPTGFETPMAPFGTYACRRWFSDGLRP